ncbi:hypothetical protein POMI540_4346 [Schizosaccharomyces pombe]
MVLQYLVEASQIGTHDKMKNFALDDQVSIENQTNFNFQTFIPSDNYGFSFKNPGQARDTQKAGNNEDGTNMENVEDIEAAARERRRKNTEASARFRLKKKLREKHLEKTVEEYELKIARLEAKVHELEMETRFLRNLIRPLNDK